MGQAFTAGCATGARCGGEARGEKARVGGTLGMEKDGGQSLTVDCAAGAQRS